MIVLLLSGCGAIRESVAFEKSIAVKIPLKDAAKPVDSWRGENWTFQFVTLGPWEGKTPPSAWYLARKIDTEGKKDRLVSADAHWRFAEMNAPSLADDVYRRFRRYPTVIEPNLVFDQSLEPSTTPDSEAVDYCRSGKCDADGRPLLRVNKPPSWCWPFVRSKSGEISPVWHLDDDHTQLASAGNRVRARLKKEGAPRVRIGILDTGFTANHATAPRHLENEASGDIVGRFGNGGENPVLKRPGNVLKSSHGTGTLGILAGRNIEIPETRFKGWKIAGYKGPLGAAPDASVVLVRIAPNVVSLATANLAAGIDYASREKRCDVISMSHGGAPSLVWVDAVNAAYDRGTAIFAANGNFYSVTGARGLATPSAAVYPAAFYRVMGVTGVNAKGNTYAKNGPWNLLGALVRGDFDSLSGFFMRGCYGGDGSARLLWQRGKGSDRLHNNPIAAYTPNMPWASSSGRNLIDLDGAGTSSATPQVAGAAALWLQYNRRAIEEDKTPEGRPAWNSWKKVEAVYTALIANADRKNFAEIDFYLGVGILKASRALDQDYQEVAEKFPQQESAPLYYGEVIPDFLDGRRTLLGLFKAPFHSKVPRGERAVLREASQNGVSRRKALENLYYNFYLLCDWHEGTTPRERHTKRLEAKAKLAVEKAEASSR